jgi:transposase
VTIGIGTLQNKGTAIASPQYRPFTQAHPRYDEVIEPESKTCPYVSVERHCIGTDVSEALDIVLRSSGSNGRSGRAMHAGPAKALLCKRPHRRD